MFLRVATRVVISCRQIVYLRRHMPRADVGRTAVRRKIRAAADRGTWVTFERDRGVRRVSRVRMPWIQTDAVTERQKFVRLVLKGQVTMTEACRQFGISRKTGYKILAQHAEHRMAGLADVSRAPKAHPNQPPPAVEAAVSRVREAHPTWGSKKILATLDRERPGEGWPARSTIDAILKRAGAVTPRGRRRRRQPAARPLVEAVAPSDV